MCSGAGQRRERTVSFLAQLGRGEWSRQSSGGNWFDPLAGFESRRPSRRPPRFLSVDTRSGLVNFLLADHTPGIVLVTVGTPRMPPTNSDLASHAINQLLGIVADPGLRPGLDVLDLINSS